MKNKVRLFEEKDRITLIIDEPSSRQAEVIKHLTSAYSGEDSRISGFSPVRVKNRYPPAETDEKPRQGIVNVQPAGQAKDTDIVKPQINSQTYARVLKKPSNEDISYIHDNKRLRNTKVMDAVRYLVFFLSEKEITDVWQKAGAAGRKFTELPESEQKKIANGLVILLRKKYPRKP